MNIVIFSLSSRAQNQSLRVSHYLERQLAAKQASVHIVDLHELRLPVYDDTGEGEWLARWQPHLEQIAHADGFVAVSPEWGGMAAPGWFNLLHYIKHEMAHKPVMLVGVSSGRGGSYPLAQMKQAGQKNRHFVISPENLVVSGVEQMFVDDQMDESSPDYALKTRADYALKVLLEYAKALQLVRANEVIDLKNFANGV
jgi:NAD(P)H-dependent FMN reductase